MHWKFNPHLMWIWPATTMHCNDECGGNLKKMATIFNHNLPELHVDGKNKYDGCKDDEEAGEAGKGDGDGQDGLV